VRIGIASGWNCYNQDDHNSYVAKQGIETREWLVINYPLNGSNTQQLNAGSAGGTRSELTTNTTDGDKALTIKSNTSLDQVQNRISTSNQELELYLIPM
jgi:hypothetical protein